MTATTEAAPTAAPEPAKRPAGSRATAPWPVISACGHC